MESYQTHVSEDELKLGIEDEHGVVYSLDGKRLLQNRNYELKDYTVKEHTEIICDDAFSFSSDLAAAGCPPPWYCLHEIKLPNSIKVIGNQAFHKTHLSKINLPEGLLHIGSKAFFYTGIAPIKLPDSLVSIGDFAFGLILNMKEIRIPARVTSLGQAPFCNCFSLEKIDVDKENRFFTIYDGILYDYKKTRLIQSPCTKTRNFNIPDTALTCDQGAFCRDTHMEEISEISKMRWRLQRMKEILLTLVDRPCGIKTFSFKEIGKVISIKISNSIYCNIMPTYSTDGYVNYHMDANLDFITLMNALGFDKADLAGKLGMIDEVKPRKNKYKCYLNRKLARDISIKWLEDFVDEDTGEVITIPRDEVVVAEGNSLQDDDIKDLFSNKYYKDVHSILLYKHSSDCFIDWDAYYSILKSTNHFQEEALYLLDKKISHLRFLYFQKYKDYLLYAFTQAILSQKFEDEMQSVPLLRDLQPSTLLNWKEDINYVFSTEIMNLNPKDFSYSKVFKILAKSYRTYHTLAKDFYNSFSFIFADMRDVFDDGPIN